MDRAGNRRVPRGLAQVLELAARCGHLQVGGITVAIGGTKILTNAGCHSAVSCQRAGGVALLPPTLSGAQKPLVFTNQRIRPHLIAQSFQCLNEHDD